MRALNVQPSLIRRRSANQTAWPVFVIRIILDDLTRQHRLRDFLRADAARNHLPDGVERILHLPVRNLLPELDNHSSIES